MNKRKKIIWLLILSLICFGVGWYLKNSIEFNLCLISQPTCINKLTWIGNAIYYGIGALAFIFLILAFAPQAFSAWKKFAVWFIPLATLLFIFYPDPGSGDYFSPYPEQIFQWVSILYVIISLVIIIWNSKEARVNSK